MIPTISNAESWNAAVLVDRAKAIGTLADEVETARDNLQNTTSSLFTGWYGTAADAASDHLDQEQRHFANAIEEVRVFAELVRSAEIDLTLATQTVKDKIAAARLAGFIVDDAGVRAGSDTVTDVGEPDATAHFEAIQAALTTLGQLDDEYAARIRGCAADIIAVTPTAAAFSAGDATNDWKLISEGDLTQEDIGRLLSNLTAAGLDPQEWAIIEDGRTVATLPPGALEYLESLYRDAGAEGVMEIQRALEQNGSPQAAETRAALATGIMTLSNESVRDSLGNSGGYGRLPQDIRDLTQVRPGSPTLAVPGTPQQYLESLHPRERAKLEAVPGAAVTQHRDESEKPADQRYVEALREADEFWRFVDAGQGVPGDQLGVELVKSVSEQVEADESDHDVYDSYPVPDGYGESQLDVALRSHEVSERILTGDLDGDGTAETQRDDILNPLFLHDWQDGGESLANMTNWMTDEKVAAYNDGVAPEPLLTTRAENAAFGLSQYLSHAENYERFMDIDGDNTVNLGEHNPYLVQGIADGLAGYIPALAGEADGNWAQRELESGERFDHAQRIFTLMASDPVASAEFGQTANDFRTMYESHFARSVLDTESGTAYGPAWENAQYAGRLQALLDTGIYNVAAEQTTDQQRIQEIVDARRADAFGTGWTVARNIIALDPRFSAGIGIPLDIAQTSIRDAFVPPSESTPQMPFTLNSTDQINGNYAGLLAQLVHQDGLPDDPGAIAELRKVGLLNADGELRLDISPNGQAEVGSVLSNVLSNEYGLDLGQYNNSFILGYDDIAPQVNLTLESGGG